MTPTREQVLAAVRTAYDTVSGAEQTITDAIMALLEPKPPARRWILEHTSHFDNVHIPYSKDFGRDPNNFTIIPRGQSGVSMRELPPMPSMEQLEYVYGEAWLGKPGGPDDSRKAGITAVLRACGLEVEEAKR